MGPNPIGLVTCGKGIFGSRDAHRVHRENAMWTWRQSSTSKREVGSRSLLHGPQEESPAPLWFQTSISISLDNIFLLFKASSVWYYHRYPSKLGAIVPPPIEFWSRGAGWGKKKEGEREICVIKGWCLILNDCKGSYNQAKTKQLTLWWLLATQK